MVDLPYNHLGLFPQCGICTDTIARHERTVALYGNNASTSFRAITRPFLFPQLGHSITQVDGFSLCRRPGCRQCAASPEFVPLHWDCFEVFRNQSSIKWADALCRLWLAASWRTPWRGALPLCFPIDAARSPSLKALCIICKLPQLHRLPLELLQMIQSYSEHALIWRGALAFDLAAHISNKPSSGLVTIPLKDILFWEREKELQVTLSRPLPLIRITVDSIGISKIERISHQAYKGECYRSCVYVVEQEQAIIKCKAQFKDGFSRLELASSFSSPPAIWNTPNPPDLQLCRAYERRSLSQYRRFFAVEVASIRGITFFFSSRQLYGVHMHWSGAPCALSSLQRLPPRRRRSASWCYLPITNQDQMIVLGTRTSPNQNLNILVRMEKAGDVVIGEYISNPIEDRCLAWHAPITLVYGEPQEGQPIPYFGAYCQPPTKSEFPHRFQAYKPTSFPTSEEMCLSMASLEGLQSVEIFHDQDSQHCRGMLLYYRNGGCRAVGQCRVHVDSSKQFFQPSHICFRTESVRGRGHGVLYTVQVNWAADSHTHRETGWDCQPLEGVLAFWYTHNSSFIAIEK